MSALQERLGAALELDALGFSGEQFADARLGSVRARVKRRRAARSAGVGGASVLSVGALAVGVTHLPFASLGVAGPGASGVICTTSSPNAVVVKRADIPEGATLAFVDNTTGDVAFGGLSDGVATVWYADITPIVSRDRRPIVMTFPSDETLELKTVDAGLVGGAWQGSDVSVLPIQDYIEQLNAESRSTDASQSPTDAGQTTTIATLNLGTGTFVITDPSDGSSVTVQIVDGVATVADGGGISTLRAHDGQFAVPLPNGSVATFTLDSDGIMHLVPTMDTAPNNSFTVHKTDSMTMELAQSSPSAAAHNEGSGASVTCVTNTPEPSPSASESRSPSASPSSSPAPSTSLEASVNRPAADSPFACGFDFPSDEQGDDSVSIGATTLMSPDAARAQIETHIGDMVDSWIDASGADVPVANIEFAKDLVSIGGGSDLKDPAVQPWTTYASDGKNIADGFIIGAQFVLAEDGRVVATGSPVIGEDAPIYWDALASDVSPLYLFNSDAAFTACEGVDAGSLAEAELYAVAGVKTLDGDTQFGPVYAWKQVTPQS